MSSIVSFGRMASRPRLLAAFAVGSTAAALAYQFVQKAEAESGEPTKVFGSGLAFISLPLDSTEYVSKDTKRLRFLLPQRELVTGLPLTSALLTVSWPKGHWFPVARPYTPISSQSEPRFLELLVKHHPGGKQSSHLHSLSPGEKLLFATAIPGFKWTKNFTRRITLIAGGAGITPIFQLAQGILDDPEDQAIITLIHGVNMDGDMVLQHELDHLVKKFPGRVQVHYTVSRPDNTSPFRKGRITGEMIQQVAAPSDDHVFLSGPPAMEEAFLGTKNSPGILQQLGYSKDRIHKF